MLDKSFEGERAPGVDERLARVVRIIVEQYDGDVKAFVESNRYRIEANRKAEAASDHGDDAALRKCPSTTKIIGRISPARYSYKPPTRSARMGLIDVEGATKQAEQPD